MYQLSNMYLNLNKNRVIAIAISMLAYLGYAQPKAFLSYSPFFVPGKQAYLETYLSFIGNSIKYIKNDSAYQSSIEVTIEIKQDSIIKHKKKYNVLSPTFVDTIKRINFIDQQRFSLPNGDYTIDVYLVDNHSTSSTPQTIKSKKITINYDTLAVYMSGIQFLESYSKSNTSFFTKNGYSLIPYVSEFFPENSSKMAFYVETYNLNKFFDKQEKLLLKYYIQSYETNQTLSSYAGFSKQNPKELNALLAEFAIDNLPTGNYWLVVDLLTKDNVVLKREKRFFQRKSSAIKSLMDVSTTDIKGSFVEKVNGLDTLLEWIRCIRPISKESEKSFADNLLKTKDVNLLKQFFFNFWQNKDYNNPELAWLAYLENVKYVNKTFGTKYVLGYTTDRGRVYLQYGKPDQRSQSSMDASAYPYEIWQYYRLTNPINTNIQTNKVFVFYSPHFVASDYRLIHSDAIGEIYNTNWQSLLRGSAVLQNPATQRDTLRSNTIDNFGNHINDLFINPR